MRHEHRVARGGALRRKPRRRHDAGEDDDEEVPGEFDHARIVDYVDDVSLDCSRIMLQLQPALS